MGKTLLGTGIDLTSPYQIDFRTLGYEDISFRPYSAPGNPCPTLPLKYTLSGADGKILTEFAVDRFTLALDTGFIWQFLPEDPEKFVPYNYFWIWPTPGNKKALIVRFNNQMPHLVAIQSGFASIRNDIGIEDGMLILEARATEAIP